MQAIFLEKALEQLFYWVHENRHIADKIYKLIKDIERNGAEKGLGKPEHLKYKDGWSRRINEEHRLTYSVKDDKIYIFSCKGHYDE